MKKYTGSISVFIILVVCSLLNSSFIGCGITHKAMVETEVRDGHRFDNTGLPIPDTTRDLTLGSPADKGPADKPVVADADGDGIPDTQTKTSSTATKRKHEFKKMGRSPASFSGDNAGKKDNNDDNKIAVRSIPDTNYAELAYKYPTSIVQNEVRDIWIYVKPHVGAGYVETVLKTTIANSETDLDPATVKEDTTKVSIAQIPLFNNLKITIEDDAKIFTQNAIIPDSQVIDTIKGNTWHWTISTTSTEKEGNLVINTQTYSDKGSPPKAILSKKIPIKIKLENNWIRTWYTWLLNNPKYVIGTILVPFIIFVGKRLFKDKNKDSSTGASAA